MRRFVAEIKMRENYEKHWEGQISGPLTLTIGERGVKMTKISGFKRRVGNNWEKEK